MIDFSNFDTGWLYFFAFFVFAGWACWWILNFGDGFFGN